MVEAAKDCLPSGKCAVRPLLCTVLYGTVCSASALEETFLKGESREKMRLAPNRFLAQLQK